MSRYDAARRCHGVCGHGRIPDAVCRFGRAPGAQRRRVAPVDVVRGSRTLTLDPDGEDGGDATSNGFAVDLDLGPTGRVSDRALPRHHIHECLGPLLPALRPLSGTLVGVTSKTGQDHDH